MTWKKPVYLAAGICIGVGLLLMLFALGSNAYLLRFEPDSGANIGGGIAFMASVPVLLVGCVTALVGIVMDLLERRSRKGPR